MRVRIKTDSQLVVSQLTNECETREERLKMYKDVTEGLLEKLTAYEVIHVPRAKNMEADILSKLAINELPDQLSQVCRTEIVDRTSTESLLVCPIVEMPSPHPNPVTQHEWF